MVAGWALMVPCAFVLTVVLLPARTSASLMVFVIAVYYVLPATIAVLAAGLLTVAVLGRVVRSGLWLGAMAAWTGTAVVAGAAWLLL